MKRHTFIILVAITLLAGVLRLVNLSSNPPALYWDEASIAYNAYAIYSAGVDEHGVSWPITHFLAYGDAKPPLYIYATSLSFWLLGVSDFAVRFPSALAGIITVVLTYFLTKQLLSAKNNESWMHTETTALLASFLLAISPWHLHVSRVAYEANLALCLFIAGLVAFCYRRKRPWLLLVAAICWVATWYTFNAYRLFLPPFLLVLGVLHLKTLIKQWRWVAPSIILALVLTAPLIPFVLSDQAKLRFEEVTIFKDHAPIIEANERISQNNNALWAKVLYNRRVLFALHFLRHYTDNLKWDFLFFSGDVNPRLGYRDGGMLYLVELPLVLVGIYLLARQRKEVSIAGLFWLLLALIPAGVARETPHALRTLQLLPLPQIAIALAITYLISKRRRYSAMIITAYVLNVVFYLHVYHQHYRAHWAESWQYGYKELVTYLESVKSNYDRINVTSEMGRPHTYILYYGRYDPLEYVESRDAGGDAFGFTEVYSFDNYYFTSPDLSQKQDEKWLMVTAGETDQSSVVKTIYDLQGQVVFSIYEL